MYDGLEMCIVDNQLIANKEKPWEFGHDFAINTKNWVGKQALIDSFKPNKHVDLGRKPWISPF